ncbi:sulfurtransferase TusA family protein [Streptomyces sp. NPDC015130]|uniref:sulfurtransferase TusA family protein n=1 Tax=Streptomyces sp. NPDC015130 TaxID=3364940 RepID=UPI0036FFD1B4
MTAFPDPLDARTPAPDLVVDGTGLLCVTLLLRLRKDIDGSAPGTVVHIVATDPAAPLDLPAWCHMTGHEYLGPVPDPAGRSVYALRLVAGALATCPDAPWHRTTSGGSVGQPST